MNMKLLLAAVLLSLGLIYYQHTYGLTSLPGVTATTAVNLYNQAREHVPFLGANQEDELENSDVDESEDGGASTQTPRKAIPRTEDTPPSTPRQPTPIIPTTEKISPLQEPASPFAGMVTFKAGSAKATDPQKEYVVVTLNPSAPEPITVTGWKIRSHVTKRTATISEGARLLKEYDDKTSEPIRLYPGETAYLTTGENPLRISFKENMCTGYLAEYGTFTPALTKRCPLASDELLDTSIKSTDGECYAFADDVARCEAIPSEELRHADLSSSCTSFVKYTLTYEGCIDDHLNDTLFAKGDWRIFFEREGELWRSTNEILQLLDAEGRVVALLQY